MFTGENKFLLIFSQKSFLYCFLTVSSAFFYVWMCVQKKQKIHLCRFDIMLITSFFLLMICINVKILQDDVTYGQEVFLWCLIISYFMLKVCGRREGKYLNLILISSIPLCLESVKYILSGTDFILDISVLSGHTEDVMSFFLLVSCTASVLYCNEKNNKWKKFYLSMALLNYFVLLLQNDIVAICLMLLFLLSIPVVFPATVSLVRRNLFLCFMFLLILSNSLLLQYVKGISLRANLDLRYSIYIELLLACTGVLVFQYWEKVPKDIDSNYILMKKFPKWYRRTASVVCSILLICILIGNRMDGFPEQFGLKTWRVFASLWQNSVNISESVYQQLLGNYGVIGFFLFLFLSVLMLERITKQWQRANILRKIYFSLSVLFFVQTFFYQIQPISTPAFLVLLALSLSEKE